MKLNLTFYNFENETEKYLQQLEQFNFEELIIDRHDFLIFVKITDKNYLAFLSKLVINDAVEYGVRIFKNDTLHKNHIDIPLNIFDTISLS